MAAKPACGAGVRVQRRCRYVAEIDDGGRARTMRPAGTTAATGERRGPTSARSRATTAASTAATAAATTAGPARSGARAPSAPTRRLRPSRASRARTASRGCAPRPASSRRTAAATTAAGLAHQRVPGGLRLHRAPPRPARAAPPCARSSPLPARRRRLPRRALAPVRRRGCTRAAAPPCTRSPARRPPRRPAAAAGRAVVTSACKPSMRDVLPRLHMLDCPYHYGAGAARGVLRGQLPRDPTAVAATAAAVAVAAGRVHVRDALG